VDVAGETASDVDAGARASSGADRRAVAGAASRAAAARFKKGGPGPTAG
jgi:hypothetical protein